MNLDGSNEFTAVASPDANNALDVRANGIYATDTDTQYTAGGGLDLTGTVFSAEVSSTAGNALTIDANGLYVPDTDNDTQYTAGNGFCLLYTSPSPRDQRGSRMPSSA